MDHDLNNTKQRRKVDDSARNTKQGRKVEESARKVKSNQHHHALKSRTSTSQETTGNQECRFRGPPAAFAGLDRVAYDYGKAPFHYQDYETPRDLFIPGYGDISRLNDLERLMIDSMLSTFDPSDDNGLEELILLDRRTPSSPLLYTCGKIHWHDGDSTERFIFPLCKFIMPLCRRCCSTQCPPFETKRQDEVVAQAERVREELLALMKSFFCAHISSAYECWLHIGHIMGSDGWMEFVSYIATQFAYVVESNDHDKLNTPDEDGRLLLHRALCDSKVSFQTILEIANKNRAAVRAADNRGLLPLHIACMVSVGRAKDFGGYGNEWHMGTVAWTGRPALKVIRHVLDLDESLSERTDEDGCNALHHACRSGNPNVVKYLLGRCEPLTRAKNKENLLPIHLLCDKSGKGDIIEKVQYTDAVWQLLLAYPDLVSEAIVYRTTRNRGHGGNGRGTNRGEHGGHGRGDAGRQNQTEPQQETQRGKGQKKRKEANRPNTEEDGIMGLTALANWGAESLV